MPELTYHVSAFLDFLGASNELCLLEKMRRSGKVDQRRVKALEAAITGSRKLYEGFVAAYQEIHEIDSPGVKDPGGKKSKTRLVVPKIRYWAIADAVVVDAVCDPDDPMVCWVALGAVAAAAAVGSTCALRFGFAVRGGIAAGAGVVVGDNEFLTAGQVEAVEIEKHLAVYPRVVVSPDLLSELRNAVEVSSGAESETLRTVAEYVEKLFMRDDDGLCSVDFLGRASLLMPQGRAGIPSPDELLAEANVQAKKSLLLLMKQKRKNWKAISKWQWLHAYVRHRQKEWTEIGPPGKSR